MNAPLDKCLKNDLKDNPLVNYLTVFQNQHKVISTLYRGLILSLSGFFVLLSFLVFSIFDNQFFPLWGKVSMITIDVILLMGISKAFYELGKYKQKSLSILNQVYTYLKNDLTKIEKIRQEHRVIDQTNKKLQNKVLSFSSKSKRSIIEDYQGWDCQVCPKCHTSLEMLTEVCPQCHHQLEKTFSN